ncbi:glycosyltransferase [Nocardiopsis sp. NPDC050513]|uniref:glycosyltransferase n=1 Tax=Nocardiopsis sp. NPDC050513 TaxID=3364338 RepID=UPI0037B658BE
MASYLFLMFHAEHKDGGIVLNERLCQAMAERHDVHLLSVGNHPDIPGVNVVPLLDDAVPEHRREEFESHTGTVGGYSEKIKIHLADRSPAELGLPSGPDGVDFVVGYSDVTGGAALWIRDRFYPEARVGAALTMDPEAVLAVHGKPELGRRRVERHREVFLESDVVLAHGVKTADDAKRIIGADEVGGARPPIHTFIPGNDVGGPPPPPRGRDDPFNVLMLGRMDDLNKGAVDGALAVQNMRRGGYADTRLTLLGTQNMDIDAFHAWLGEDLDADSREFVDIRDFTPSREEISAAIAEADVVLASPVSESYGLAYAECASAGTPVVATEGNGNGFASVLKDGRLVPPEVGAMLVIDDNGSTNHDNARMGTGPATRLKRFEVISAKLMDVHDNPDAYHQAALALQNELRNYSHRDAANGIHAAMEHVRDGGTQDTFQRPGGRIDRVTAVAHEGGGSGPGASRTHDRSSDAPRAMDLLGRGRPVNPPAARASEGASPGSLPPDTRNRAREERGSGIGD